MTNVKNDNPAGRLYLVLVKLGTGINEATSLNDIIAGKFELEKSDYFEISRIYIAIINLITTSMDDVNRLGINDLHLYLEPLEKIREGFTRFGLNQPWKNYKTHYVTGVTLSQLVFVSSQLSASLNEIEIEEDEIDALLESTQELLDELRSSTIQQDFKILLLKKLVEIQQALIDYKYGLVGTDSLTDVFEHSIGTWVIYNNIIIHATAEEEEAKNIFDKFKNIVSGIGKISSTVVVKEIAESILNNAPALADTLKDAIN